MERRELVLLQKAVDDLRPDILAVVAEDVAGPELVGAARDVVFALEALVPCFGDQVEP